MAIGVRGPIKEGEYIVADATVAVSYPSTVCVGISAPMELPKELSTLFVISWDDKNGRIAERVRSKSFIRHLLIYEALDVINEILLAFKLVRVGHIDGRGMRTVGLGDTLFYTLKIGDAPMCELTIGPSIFRRSYENWPGRNQDDPHGTTPLAVPHIAADTYPVARRYVRCYELLEHGFYSEAFIVAFAVLDDLIQQMLHKLLSEKGMEKRAEREELLRGVKDRRLKIFLGPLLRILCGKDIADIWPASEAALDWLNKTRNQITHAGQKADYAMAAKAIFACINTIVVLQKHGLIDAEFSVEIFKHARVTAAQTENPPDWIPPPEN